MQTVLRAAAFDAPVEMLYTISFYIFMLTLFQIQFPRVKPCKKDQESDSHSAGDSEEKVADKLLTDHLRTRMPERISTGMLRSMIKFLEPVGQYAVNHHERMCML